MKKIHVGILVSYDYEKLKYSLPPIYEYSDAIFLAIDENSLTWSGKKFIIDESFFEWLKTIDVDKKIIIYSDNFYVPELSAIQNDTRERFMLSQKMGIGNWLVQVDADEIFIDFKAFVDDLKSYDYYLDNPEKSPIQICGFVINVYKFLDNGILYVDEPTRQYLATNYPNYKVARKTKERIIYTNHVLLHECLARTEEEVFFKIKNWGHNNEVNPEFLNKWQMANETNYQTLKNVFYLEPYRWKSLGYFPTKKIDEIKELVTKDIKLQPRATYIFKKNFGQWFKHLKIFNLKKKHNFESYF
jgi:hypothetical protein